METLIGQWLNLVSFLLDPLHFISGHVLQVSVTEQISMETFVVEFQNQACSAML
jgi:hypothetical protein